VSSRTAKAIQRNPVSKKKKKKEKERKTQGNEKAQGSSPDPSYYTLSVNFKLQGYFPAKR
jgi:hypothetical protein